MISLITIHFARAGAARNRTQNHQSAGTIHWNKQCGFEHWPAEYLGKTQKKLFCLTSWIIRERDWLLPRKLQAILVLIDWNTKCNHNQTELKKDKHPSNAHWCNIKRRQFLGWKTKLTVSSDHCSFHSGDNLKLSTDGRNSLYRLLQCLKTSRYVKQLKLENMITQKLFIVFTYYKISLLKFIID